VGKGVLLAGFDGAIRSGVFEYGSEGWIETNKGLSNLTIVQIDTTKDYNARLGRGTIWGLSEADGLFVSIDNGKTWMSTGEVYTTASGGLSPLRVQSFRISPDFDEQAGIGSVWAIRPNTPDNIIRLPAGDTDWVTTGDSPFPGHTNIGLKFTPDYSEMHSQGDIWLWSTSDPSAPPYRRNGPTGTWISVTAGLPPEPGIKSISVSPDYNDLQDHGSVWASTEEGTYRLDVTGEAWVKETSISVRDLVFSANYNEENTSGAVLGIRSNNGREVYQCLPDNFGEWQKVGGTFPISMPTIKAISVSPNYDGASQGDIWAALAYEGLYHLSPEQGNWDQIVKGSISDIILSPAFEHDRTLILASDQGVLKYVPPAIDLDLHITSQEEIAPGSLATATFQYANLGSIEAKASTLTANLPDNMAFVTSNLSPTQTTPLVWALGDVVSEMRGLITASFKISPYVQFGEHLTVTAQIQSTSPEPYKDNNTSSTIFEVINPNWVDVGVDLSAPPILTPGSPAIYNAWTNNAYGKTVPMATLTLYLPQSLELHSANPQPISLSPAIWHIGPLAAGISQPIILTTTVAPTLPFDSKVAVTASITTTASDENPLNNTATITTSTTLTDAQSLILVAPERLTDQYGASPLLSKLHQLAAHPRVQGAVVDVLTNRDVRATYASWDADPSSATKANEVAMAIKALIDDYTLTYPNLRYLVLVGNDAMLPFYRVRDQNATHWHERKYCPHTPVGTVHSALCADYFLTDDFYADRAPTTPNSPFWKDEHPLYLPDFAIGRLVETPEEMIAAIDTFLSSSGETPLNPTLIGTHSHLVNDLGSLQCKALQDAGLTTTCTTGPNQFRTHVRQGTWGSLWAAFHSNHQKLGTLSAFSLKESNPGDGIAILASIGCHSGTSVNDGDALHLSYDLPQAGQHRGWLVIAPTAYAYASYLDVEYSEALMQELTQQLLRNDTQTLGLSMIRAKQAYYADRAWFDYTDEKVLLPMTLYGLPMTHVTLPSYVQHYTEEKVPLVDSRELQYLTVMTHTISGVTFTTQTTEDGTYYSYQDQMIAQEGYPIQPTTDIPLPATIQDRTLRGIRLQSATYADETPFDPVIAQSWAIGEPQSRLAAEPPLALTGWDRSLPHQLGHFQGLYENENRAALNLTLGAFHAETETERQFTDLEIVALYGKGTDYVPPTITEVSGFRTDVKRRFHAKVEDNEGLWQVTVLCDDGNNTLTSVPMRESSSPRLWIGQTPDYVTRYYLQAVDINGNITRTDWRPLTTGHSLYLPLILR
jgi:hypothetical protein